MNPSNISNDGAQPVQAAQIAQPTQAKASVAGASRKRVREVANPEASVAEGKDEEAAAAAILTGLMSRPGIPAWDRPVKIAREPPLRELGEDSAKVRVLVQQWAKGQWDAEARERTVQLTHYQWKVPHCDHRVWSLPAHNRSQPSHNMVMMARNLARDTAGMGLELVNVGNTFQVTDGVAWADESPKAAVFAMASTPEEFSRGSPAWWYTYLRARRAGATFCQLGFPSAADPKPEPTWTWEFAFVGCFKDPNHNRRIGNPGSRIVVHAHSNVGTIIRRTDEFMKSWGVKRYRIEADGKTIRGPDTDLVCGDGMLIMVTPLLEGGSSGVGHASALSPAEVEEVLKDVPASVLKAKPKPDFETDPAESRAAAQAARAQKFAHRPAVVSRHVKDVNKAQLSKQAQAAREYKPQPLARVHAVKAALAAAKAQPIYQQAAQPISSVRLASELRDEEKTFVPQMCRQFAQGTCLRADCKFAHVMPLPSATPAVAPKADKKPEEPTIDGRDLPGVVPRKFAGRGLISNRADRMYDTAFKEYVVPNLAAVEDYHAFSMEWMNSHVRHVVKDGEEGHNYFYDTETIEVSLPSTVVEEAATWWLTGRKSGEADYFLLTKKVKELAANLALTSQELFDVETFVPLLAYAIAAPRAARNLAVVQGRVKNSAWVVDFAAAFIGIIVFVAVAFALLSRTPLLTETASLADTRLVGWADAIDSRLDAVANSAYRAALTVAEGRWSWPVLAMDGSWPPTIRAADVTFTQKVWERATTVWERAFPPAQTWRPFRSLLLSASYTTRPVSKADCDYYKARLLGRAALRFFAPLYTCQASDDPRLAFEGWDGIAMALVVAFLASLPCAFVFSNVRTSITKGKALCGPVLRDRLSTVVIIAVEEGTMACLASWWVPASVGFRVVLALAETWPSLSRKQAIFACATCVPLSVALLNALDHPVASAFIACNLAAVLLFARQRTPWRDLVHFAAHTVCACVPHGLSIPFHFYYNCFSGRQMALTASAAFYSALGFRTHKSCNVEVEVKEFKKGAKIKEPPPGERHPKGMADDETPENIVQLGFGTEGYVPVAYPSNYVNELTAVKARVIKATPEIDLAYVEEFLQWRKDTFHQRFPGLNNVKSMDFEEYLAKSNSSPSVKAKIRRAREAAEAEGITEDSVLSRKKLHELTKRESFGKVELNNYRTPRGRKKKASRLIQGGSATYIAFVGPFIAALQGRIKKIWDGKKTPILFTSGCSAERVAEFISSVPESWKTGEDDINEYDASFHELMCEYEVWFVRRCGAKRLVCDLMEANVRTHGTTSCGIVYSVDGVRDSGDPFTSLFNSTQNADMKIFIICKTFGWDVLFCFLRIIMIVQGDDNVFRICSELYINFYPAMLKLGYKSLSLWRRDLHEVTFCSQNLMLTEQGWRFVPQVGRLLAKFGYFINPPAVGAARLMRGVALGLYAACSPLRPLRALLDRVLDLTRDSVAFIRDQGRDWSMRHRVQAESPLAFADMCMKYMWSHADEEDFEGELAKMQLGDTTNHATFVYLCDHDTSGPADIVTSSEEKTSGFTLRPASSRSWIQGSWVHMATVFTLMLCFTTAVAANLSCASPTTLTAFEPEDWGMMQMALRTEPAPFSCRRSDGSGGIDPTTEHSAGGGLENYPGLQSNAIRTTAGLPLHSLTPGELIRVSVEMSSNTSKQPKKQQQQQQQRKLAGKAKKEIKAVKKAVKSAGIAGRGDYRPTSLSKVSGRGDYLGDLFGGLAAKAGTWAGNALQGGFRRLTGFGDYRSHGPRSNSLVPKQTGPNTDCFTMGAMGVKFGGAAPRVQHREFVGPVLSTGAAFSTRAFRIQPGVTGANVLFPWGSSVANCFQQYILHGAILEFVSTSSDYAANSALGSVMMSTVYDAESTGLATQEAVDNNEYTTTAKPSVSFYHPIECASKDNQVNVRYVNSSNSNTPSTDERLNDVGIFQLSTTGISAAVGTQLGELWMTYDIEFLKSSLPDIHIGTTFQADMVGSVTQPTWGGNIVYNPRNSLPAVISSGGGSIMNLTLPGGYNGNYMISLYGAVTSGSMTSWSVTAALTSNFSYVPLYPTNSNPSFTGSSLMSTGSQIAFSMAVSTTAEGAPSINTIAFSFAGVVAVAVPTVNWSLIITPLDNDVGTAREEAARATKAIDDIVTERLRALLGQSSASSSQSSGAPMGPPTTQLASQAFDEYEYGTADSLPATPHEGGLTKTSAVARASGESTLLSALAAALKR